MKDSKSFGFTPGSHAGSPAKAPSAPARPTGVPTRPGGAPPSSGSARTARPASPSLRPAASVPPKGPAKPGQSGQRTGKVVHDERGNAVWDWLKQTGRHAIESTTRMLKKLESPELKVEQPQEEELRIAPDGDNCAGGGYDPYNQPTKSRRTPIK